MIFNQVYNFTKTLIKKTASGEISWEILSTLSPVESGFPDIIEKTSERVFTNEYRQILPLNSFFFYHHEGIVALIRIDNTSGRDGSHHSDYALYLQTKKNSPPKVYDNKSFQEQFNLLNTTIINYLNKDDSMPDDLYQFMQF